MKHQNTVENKWGSLTWMCLLTVLVLGLVCAAYLRFELPHGNRNARPLEQGWSYSTDWDDWLMKQETLPDAGSWPSGEGLHLTRSMANEPEVENAALLLETSHQWLRMFLDDQLFYEYVGTEADNPGYAVHIISLPPGYTNSTLHVEITSPYTTYAHSSAPIYLGDAISLGALLVSLSAKGTVLLFISATSGILLILFGIFLSYQNPKSIRWGIFAFGLFSIFVGLDSANTKYLLCLVFSPQAVFWICMSAWLLLPVSLLVYLRCQFTVTKKIVTILLVAFSAFDCILLILAIIDIKELPETIIFTNPVYAVGLFILAVLSALELRKKNQAIYFIGLSLIFLVLSGVMATKGVEPLCSMNELCRVGGLVLLMAFVWFYHLHELKSKQMADHEEMRMLRLKNEMALETHEIAMEHVRQVGLLDHEFRHHTAVLLALSEQGEYVKVADYLREINNLQLMTDGVVYCENHLINSILARITAETKQHHIVFGYEAEVPKILPIEESDLCSLLMNLLENAVEACLHVAEGNRWIELQLRVQGNFLVVSCCNAMLADQILFKEGKFHTTKESKNFHGYGIAVMKEVVKKYDSKLNIDYDQSVFKVKTILRLRKEKSANDEDIDF